MPSIEHHHDKETPPDKESVTRSATRIPRKPPQVSDTPSNRTARAYGLSSPPETPLPSLSVDDLRSGIKLDFVTQYNLEQIVREESLQADARDSKEAPGPQSSAIGHPNGGYKDDDWNSTIGEEQDVVEDRVLKLSPKQILDLTSSEQSLPSKASPPQDESTRSGHQAPNGRIRATTADTPSSTRRDAKFDDSEKRRASTAADQNSSIVEELPEVFTPIRGRDAEQLARPTSAGRAFSTPVLRRRLSTSKTSTAAKDSTKQLRHTPAHLRIDNARTPSKGTATEGPEPSPMPRSMPMPPFSLPTYLQLELSSQRPSPLYIHRSATCDFPYESSQVKLERLKNFILLPPQVEQILWFGALTCMDAWLYTFTILPLRFIKALTILLSSWVYNLAREMRYLAGFIYNGSRRMWKRQRRRSAVVSVASTSGQDKTALEASTVSAPSMDRPSELTQPQMHYKHRRSSAAKHRRTKSIPSTLSPDHKADILKGSLILLSCTVLMYFDASRMYHGIRGQAAIKLYVIYNVLEVCDRLFSALGQDVLECLFSKESLERKADGRSKVLRPLWLFGLALAYNLVHSTALFYQVITLNVAVNSYSNALLTLLLSNQFVEIKSTVFKKFEKENLFQLTCADVVERFQLWLMLLIIASRNIIETGGLNFNIFSSAQADGAASASSMSILPSSFTLFPAWTGQVLAPFFVVLGSEMLVDWLKHAYITKFNNVKPAIYGRFLDILAKDYYSNAFGDPNLTRRLGLPVIPLACLFIRASVQTYHMFIATHMPPPLPSTATSLSTESGATSPSTTAALAHIDHLFQRALYGTAPNTSATYPSYLLDLLLPFILPLTTLLLIFLLLLFLKLLLGIALLSFARSRYRSMKQRESTNTHADGRRVGGWGVVEVDEDKRRWIYADDADGARRLREREAREKEKARNGTADGFGRVERYSMVAKRIW